MQGDHLLRDCPGIPRVLEVWSHDPARPSSSSEAHGDATLSTGNGKKKGKIRIPCRLCEGNHPLHLCPLMDKASVLESLTAPSPQLPRWLSSLSSDPSPVDKEIDFRFFSCPSSSSRTWLCQPVPDQPLVGKSVDSSSPPLITLFSEEHHCSCSSRLLRFS
jgi:hypothetical protein